MGSMEFVFEGAVVEWRGPAPFYFVAIPPEESAEIKGVARGIEYWGQVPVTARIRDTHFDTALFPKDGRYLLPLKDAIRKAAGIALDEVVAVELRSGGGSAPAHAASFGAEAAADYAIDEAEALSVCTPTGG